MRIGTKVCIALRLLHRRQRHRQPHHSACQAVHWPLHGTADCDGIQQQGRGRSTPFPLTLQASAGSRKERIGSLHCWTSSGSGGVLHARQCHHNHWQQNATRSACRVMSCPAGGIAPLARLRHHINTGSGAILARSVRNEQDHCAPSAPASGGTAAF